MGDSDKTDIHSVKVLGEGAFGIVDLVVSATHLNLIFGMPEALSFMNWVC